MSRIYCTFLAFAAGATVLAWLVASLYAPHVDGKVVDASMLLPLYRSLLSPKPVERFTFLLLASSLPAVAFLYALMARRSSVRPVPGVLSRAIPLGVAVAFGVHFARFGFDESLLTGKTPTGAHPVLMFCGLVVVAALACTTKTKVLICATDRSTRVISWVLFVSSAVLQLLAWRIVNETSVTEGATWSTSMDAVIYSVSQVVGGRTVLADFPSQYGLFPEFIAPALRFFGLSIFSFSVLFGVMQLASLGAVFCVAQRALRHPLFKVGFGVALVMVTYETCLFLVGVREQYLQYWPVRFFWPALSVLAFNFYTRKPSLCRAAVMSLVGAIASLWNADSGVMVEIAFGAFLIEKWVALFSRDRAASCLERRAIILKLLLHVGVFTIAIATVALYLSTKADRSLQWVWLFGYQKLFYGLGFMMLPLPMMASPWIAILGVYLMGILVAASTWHKSPRNRSADLLLYASLLGIGLFVYYEGRSHVLNLVTVSWPALLAASLMADRLVRATAAGILGRGFAAPAAIVGGIVLLCCVAFVRGIPMLADSARTAIDEWSVPASPVVSDEIAFISSNTRKGETCIILSKRQGLYHASLRLVSPLIGPGIAETLTVSDRDSMIAQMRKEKFECVFVGMDKSAPDLDVDLLRTLPSYRVVRSNLLKTMVQLSPN
ncbi:hypothetical protein DIE22_09895 [Burkholderia sp. Bp9142]|nr:hypothetical protein DIE22_09895 [Burkholderia sp. Bp9142]